MKKEEVKAYIKKIYEDISVNKKYSLFVISALKHKVDIAKVQDVLYLQNRYVNIKDSELYWLINALKALKEKYNIDDESINLKITDGIFTEREIYEFDNIYIKVDKEENNVVEINGVTEVERGKIYLAPKISIRKLKKMFDDNFVVYNFDTQRDPQIKDIKIAKVFLPTLNKNQVKEIKKAIKNNKFVPNTITINVLENGKERYDFEVDKSTGDLDIGKFLFQKGNGSTMDIIDGYHRCNAIFELIEEDKEFDMYMHLKITVFTIEEAQNYIRQESLGMRITEVTQNRFKDDAYNETLKQINTLGGTERNVLFGKLNNNVVDFSKNICSYDVFRESIEDWFTVKKVFEIKNTARYLVDFYNELFYLLKLDSEDVSKNNILLQNNMFILYNYIAYKIMNSKEWKVLLEKYISNIDFNDENLWNNLKITSKRSDKKIRKEIYKYVNSLPVEV